MNTLYEKAVELLVSDIQDKALKEKVEAINERAEIEINEHSTIIFYPNKHFDDGLIETSTPLTRRERRKLERKKKK